MALVVAAVISLTLLAPAAKDPGSKINSLVIKDLDEKAVTVMKLTAATAAASVAVSAIPGDATTPIANKFADLSSYFMVILCVIFIEKYLITIFGMAAFYLLIPLGCVIGILYQYGRM